MAIDIGAIITDLRGRIEIPEENKCPVRVRPFVLHGMGGSNGPFVGDREHVLDLVVVEVALEGHYLGLADKADYVGRFFVDDAPIGEKTGTRGTWEVRGGANNRRVLSAQYDRGHLSLYCNRVCVAKNF